MIRIAAFCLAVLVGACAAGGAAYGPARRLGEPGYAETRIETNRFRVVYQGGAGADPVEVEALALRRAAELTLAEGFAWFVVDEREGTAPEQGRRAPRIGVGVGGARGGFGGGFGGGVGVDLTPRPGARFDLLIRLGRGPTPTDAAGRVYDAQSVLPAAEP